ncbi:MAG: hypothetical protein AAF596_03875 [Planctomycetota bacterium]
MSIKDLSARFTLPERHRQLTPVCVSIAGYLDFHRRLLASLDELERTHPSPKRSNPRVSLPRSS